MRINKYLPFALIYFFLNSAGLPFGLTYLTLLSPLLYYWVVTTRGKEILWPFLALILPFVVVHTIFVEVNIKTYLVSLLNLTAVYIFCQAFYTFLLVCRDIGKILRTILLINFILCLIALPIYFTSFAWIFWFEQVLTKGVDSFLRLRFFTYEASYYATLCIPLFYYFFLTIILKQNKTSAWLLLPMILLPFVLSFSLGVISALIFSMVIVFLVHFSSLIRKKRVLNLIVISLMILLPAIFIVVYFFPDNTLFYRLENVTSGRDTSGKGRTSEAFILSFKLLQLKSELFGIGLGQIKVLGTEIIRDFYLYPLDYKIFAIPNASAETLAIFGMAGLFIRLFTELFLFFYTRVWTNYFRLFLFVFMFIYQFTGSFLTNHAEYVIWIFAFTEVFPQFRVQQEKQQAGEI